MPLISLSRVHYCAAREPVVGAIDVARLDVMNVISHVGSPEGRERAAAGLPSRHASQLRPWLHERAFLLPKKCSTCGRNGHGTLAGRPQAELHGRASSLLDDTCLLLIHALGSDNWRQHLFLLVNARGTIPVRTRDGSRGTVAPCNLGVTPSHYSRDASTFLSRADAAARYPITRRGVGFRCCRSWQQAERRDKELMVTRTANMQLDGSTLLADQPEFRTVQQSAELLSVSKWLLYEAIRLGELPVIRWGRRVVVERNQLRQFLLTKRDPGQTAH